MDKIQALTILIETLISDTKQNKSECWHDDREDISYYTGRISAFKECLEMIKLVDKKNET